MIKATLLTLFGVILILVSLGLSLLNPFSDTLAKSNYSNSKVVEVMIPFVYINSPVVKGGVKGGKWMLSNNHVMSIQNNGNFILYAHNKKGLFKNLKDVSLEDLVIVKKQDGNIYTYKIYSIEKIDPSDVEKVYSNNKNVLILYTCTGLFDTKRLVLKANPITSFDR